MGPRGGTTGPPGPEVEKGDPAVPNSGTNTTWAAMDGDHMGPVVRRWHRECTPRARCAGCPHVGALRAALARRAPPPNARKSRLGPKSRDLQGWLSTIRDRMHVASHPKIACGRAHPAVRKPGQCEQYSQRVSHICDRANRPRDPAKLAWRGRGGGLTAPTRTRRHISGPIHGPIPCGASGSTWLGV